VKRYLFARIGRALLTIWFTVSVVFVITRLSGDPTFWLLPDDAPPDVREQLRTHLGLDRPFVVQYATYWVKLLQGDLGKSFYHNRPVVELYFERFPATLALSALAFGLALAVGIPSGVMAGIRRNSAFDRILISGAIAGHTTPNFVLAILLILVFSLHLRLFPSSGMGSPLHYVMPVVALSFSPASSFARLSRSSILDVLRQDYMTSARAKGVPEPVVIVKHGLRNAMIPILTIIGLQVGGLIGGSVVIETVFGWPGVGGLVVQSAQRRDYPLLQFGVLFIAAVTVTINSLIDIAYGVLDPRIRLGQGKEKED
jgi:ABC-type dipeptide/oligopeptide/nickel transport system permease component